MEAALAATGEEDRLDDVFHALADPTRRAILARLARRPATVTDLAKPFSMSLPAVSKHVRVLERAGWISRDIDGREHRCSLESQALTDAEEWLEPYREFWASHFAALNFLLSSSRRSASRPAPARRARSRATPRPTRAARGR
jgi:DNA-binding transcriptional ArsR family regulator